jgi:uncharacterized protein
MSPASPLCCFVADATLGKLARYLRLAGFDTLLDIHTPSAGRLSALAHGHRTILTRSHEVHRRLGATIPLIYICANEPSAQARQVVTELSLQPEQLRPMTRCSVCNHVLVRQSKVATQGQIPDYVWQQHPEFNACPQCHRIYWPGSHARRWRDQMERWFGAEKKNGF